jgi:hypothetical protein
LDGSVSTVREEGNENMDGVTSMGVSAMVTSTFLDTIMVPGTGMVEILPTVAIGFTADLCSNGPQCGIAFSPYPTASLTVNGIAETSGTAFFLSGGTTYQIEGLMSAGLDGSGLPYANLCQIGVGGCTADVADEYAEITVLGSADFYLDVLTPGASIESGSGHDYTTPASSVPEPSSVWLALPALAFVLLRSRRARFTIST